MATGHPNCKISTGGGGPVEPGPMKSRNDGIDGPHEVAKRPISADANTSALDCGDPQGGDADNVAELKNLERNKSGRLNPVVQARLGETLRVAYQALVDTPVPAKFLVLLSRLAKSEDPD